MFKLKKEWGDHKIYSCDTSKFVDFFNELYNTKKLDMLHLKSDDYMQNKDNLNHKTFNGSDVDLHKIFYKEIKKNDKFKKLYCSFIKDIYKHFFPNEKYMIFQTFPSVRFVFPNGVGIPAHKDSDWRSNHPLGEKNFLVPITEMKNTSTIYIESEEDKKDFKNINLKPGDLFNFHGNLCTHYNEKNIENKLRISFDFRIIKYDDYMKYLKTCDVKKTNPRDIELKRQPTLMLIGRYYQCFKRNTSLYEMNNWYRMENIMQHRPTFGKEEAEATYKYMLEDTFITEYKKTQELEKMICSHLNCKHCIMTTSGTTAIILSLMSLDLDEGSEIIVPNYTMIATVNAVKMLKLKPVIIDVDKDTYTLNLENIKKNVTNKTKAIIHVSLNNRYKDLNSIVKFCDDNNIFLIEDSAQSLGCKINGKSLGTFGKIGCFSLSTPKIISTGQGGFCVTDDDKLAKTMIMIKNFGRKESGKDNFEVFGINLKITDLQAVIGIEQMKKLDWRVERMREIYKIYYAKLKGVVDMKKPLNTHEWMPWFVDIFTNKRNELVKFLKKHKISTRPVYGEINKTKMYYSDKILPNSNYVSTHGLFLPSYITIMNKDIDYICKLIKLFFLK